MTTPDIAEIYEQCIASMDASIEGTTARLRHSTTSVLATTLAGALHGLYGYLFWSAEQILPDRASEEGLTRWGKLLGVQRRESSATILNIVIGGNDNVSVPAGAVLIRADGVQYQTETDGYTNTSVNIRCVLAGVTGNCSVGTTLRWSPTLAGVSGTTSVASVISIGRDLEAIETWRRRILNVLASPRSSGRVQDYVRWTYEISSVTRAWCLPTHIGPGTVGVCFMCDNDGGLPTDEQLAFVRAHLVSRMPVGVAELVVFAPVLKPINFRILLSPNSTSVRSAVGAALSELILTAAMPGGVIRVSHLREAISSASGEFDHVLISPDSDISVASGELSVIGELLWS